MVGLVAAIFGDLGAVPSTPKGAHPRVGGVLSEGLTHPTTLLPPMESLQGERFALPPWHVERSEGLGQAGWHPVQYFSLS